MRETASRVAALITTPLDVLVCRPCDNWDADRFRRDAVGEYAYCLECGSSNLDDLRSVFEVFREAYRNYLKVEETDFERAAVRLEHVLDLAKLAKVTPTDHCMDCTTHSGQALRIIKENNL